MKLHKWILKFLLNLRSYNNLAFYFSNGANAKIEASEEQLKEHFENKSKPSDKLITNALFSNENGAADPQ